MRAIPLRTYLATIAFWVATASIATGEIIYVAANRRVDFTAIETQAAARVEAIIIDHNCVDLSAIPDNYIAGAASLRVLMRHASVGQGIDWGLECLAGNRPTNSACSGFVAGTYDRGNWVFELRGGNWQGKVDDLVSQGALRVDDFDVFMTKLCYIDALGSNHPDWEYFRSHMEQLEADYPDKKFVWWTIPLTRDGQPGTDVFNALMRSYCAANNKILFDIADIECHDPDGTKLTNAAGNEVISQNYTKEIHAGHLNIPGRVRVASAFWRLMARLAGWQKVYDTIQAAIDDANDGDMVIVKPGTYTGPGNRDIDFKGKAITVRSERGAATCIIDCQGSRDEFHRGFHFHSGEDVYSVLDGFTVTGGCAPEGGGIACVDSSPTISKCVLTHNEAGYYGGGIHCYYNGLSKPYITRCIIAENKAVNGGGLTFCDGVISESIIRKNQAIEGGGLTGCGGTIRDCVINANMAHAWAGGLQHCDGQIDNCIVSGNFGGGFFACNGAIRNCTVVGNTYDGFFACWQGPITNCIIRHNLRSQVAHPRISICYSNIQGGWPGEGNTDMDPCFIEPGSWDPNGTPEDLSDDFWIDGDYHLKSQAGRWDPNSETWVKDDVTSPSIDAGNPMSPIGYEPFPNGGILNMGAYGGTAEASKSYFGEPVCETIIAGDINGDCKVDFTDFRLMVLHWLEDNR